MVDDKKQLILDVIIQNPGIYRAEIMRLTQADLKTIDRWTFVLQHVDRSIRVKEKGRKKEFYPIL